MKQLTRQEALLLRALWKLNEGTLPEDPAGYVSTRQIAGSDNRLKYGSVGAMIRRLEDYGYVCSQTAEVRHPRYTQMGRRYRVTREAYAVLDALRHLDDPAKPTEAQTLEELGRLPQHARDREHRRRVRVVDEQRLDRRVERHGLQELWHELG